MTKERVFLLVGNCEAVRNIVSEDSCIESSKIGFVGIPVFPAEILLGLPSAVFRVIQAWVGLVWGFFGFLVLVVFGFFFWLICFAFLGLLALSMWFCWVLVCFVLFF